MFVSHSYLDSIVAQCRQTEEVLCAALKKLGLTWNQMKSLEMEETNVQSPDFICNYIINKKILLLVFHWAILVYVRQYLAVVPHQ